MDRIVTVRREAKIGHDPGRKTGPMYKTAPYGDYWYVELPSGMRHWFRTEAGARSSDYWYYRD